MYIFKYTLFLLLLLHPLVHAENKALEQVTLQLQWKHQFEFAGFYAAKEKGFYKDVGLDVSFVEFNETIDISDEVLLGNAQYGLSYSSIIADYLNGKPLLFLANFFKQSPLVLIAQADIKTPAALKNKKIMGLSNNIHNITLFTMLNKFNIHATDIENVPASFTIDDFIAKKVDAMSVFTTNELYYLDQKGAKYTLFDPTAYGAKYYDVNLFTSKKELLAHPKRVKNFREASIKGWEYALTHQDEIIDLIIQKYNTQKKSKEALQFEAKQIEYIMLPNVHKIGSIDNERVKIIAENFMQAGFIKNGKQRQIKDFIYAYRDNILHLSDEEKKYLLNKKEITICVDPNWMPFEKIENNQYIGLGAEYMQRISHKLRIPITLVQTSSWAESINFAQKRKCDIISMMVKNEKYEKYWDFTSPYIEAPLVMATKSNQLFIDDIQHHMNKKWGVVKGYAIIQILKKKFPHIQIVEVDSVAHGLQEVEKGKLFGYIDNAYTVSYAIQKEFIGSISIVGRIPEKVHYSIAARNDEPYLQSILTQAIASIDENKKQDILNQWVSVTYAQKFNNRLFWYIFTPFLLLALILIIRQYLLQRYNRKLNEY
ncbi:MAG: ABC transporter substrate-binding protein [Campylobacterota bacterium]|nr:ABC transporter substrate-binding protein [Campylobacterota bacterium]